MVRVIKRVTTELTVEAGDAEFLTVADLRTFLDVVDQHRHVISDHAVVQIIGTNGGAQVLRVRSVESVSSVPDGPLPGLG